MLESKALCGRALILIGRRKGPQALTFEYSSHGGDLNNVGWVYGCLVNKRAQAEPLMNVISGDGAWLKANRSEVTGKQAAVTERVAATQTRGHVGVCVGIGLPHKFC